MYKYKYFYWPCDGGSVSFVSNFAVYKNLFFDIPGSSLDILRRELQCAFQRRVALLHLVYLQASVYWQCKNRNATQTMCVRSFHLGLRCSNARRESSGLRLVTLGMARLCMERPIFFCSLLLLFGRFGFPLPSGLLRQIDRKRECFFRFVFGGFWLRATRCICCFAIPLRCVLYRIVSCTILVARTHSKWHIFCVTQLRLLCRSLFQACATLACLACWLR